jgi:hypothetical protein
MHRTQAMKISEEDSAAIAAQASPERKQHQHRVAEALKQHPEWQKVQAWKKRIKVGLHNVQACTDVSARHG